MNVLGSQVVKAEHQGNKMLSFEVGLQGVYKGHYTRQILRLHLTTRWVQQPFLPLVIWRSDS